jgi:hypothetical protein
MPDIFHRFTILEGQKYAVVILWHMILIIGSKNPNANDPDPDMWVFVSDWPDKLLFLWYFF